MSTNSSGGDKGNVKSFRAAQALVLYLDPTNKAVSVPPFSCPSRHACVQMSELADQLAHTHS